MLRELAGTGLDYINASFINVRTNQTFYTIQFASKWYYGLHLYLLQGYRQRGTYIATQTPMENTVSDFWKMIWEYESKTIVVLCKMTEDGEVTIHSVNFVSEWLIDMPLIWRILHSSSIAVSVFLLMYYNVLPWHIIIQG